MNKSIRYPIAFLIGLLLLIASSCDERNKEEKEEKNETEGSKPMESMFVLYDDNGGLRPVIGNCYYAQHEDEEMVMLVDSVEAINVYGKIYFVGDKLIVKPKHFKALMETGSKAKQVIQLAIAAGAKATESNSPSSFTLYLIKNDSSKLVSFHHLDQPDFLPVKSDFQSPVYQVGPPEEVCYATASGYWSSYEKEALSKNDYWGIIKEKISSLTSERPVKLSMDIYQPKCSDNTRRPLLMLIHGGAFFIGDKKTVAMRKWSEYFASLGYVVASINYRLGFGPTKEGVDRAGYKAVQDAHAAMRYLVHHADKYHINPDYLFVGGSSAGGITALNLAFMRNPNRPTDVVNGRPRISGDSNLGPVDAVNPKYKDSFTIKGVINMWGAVHDTAMLGNSKGTAILSFHGDADEIVAYGYDYPFKNPPTPIKNFFTAFNINPPKMTPMNELLFDMMYGSSYIHHRAKLLRMQNELHTKRGGPHSLHENDDGTLSPYFQLIQDTTQAFLFRQVVPYPVELKELPKGSQWFGLNNGDELQSVDWKVDGGVILENRGDRIRVVLFSDVFDHQIHISGRYKSGAGMMNRYSLIGKNWKKF